MPIPLVVWAAAGIGAAGLKLYKSATSAENMVKNAIERYNEERFKFYKVLEQLTPEVENLGHLKLHIWGCYDKVFAILEKIDNLPGHYTYKSHKNLHMLPQDVRKLKRIRHVVERIQEKKLDTEGTGMLTVLALQGGAASSYSQSELERDEAKLVMEKIMDQPLYTSEVTVLDEMSVLESIMCFPKVLRPGYFSDKDGSKMTKDQAVHFKTDTDTHSLLLADAEARGQRLLEVVVHVRKTMELLKNEQREQIQYLQHLLTTKNDYSLFTLEEKDRLNFLVAIGFVLRELARTDIVLKNGSMAILNRSGLRVPLGKAQDLLPSENLALLDEK
ncbi:MAG: hypothetical protein ACI3X3_06480 [Acidaminococcus sp.]|uniref:hypothetical protein n=1 Tax=Acidaminococcus sp. TaxID=1872103 RepID=UPI003F171753